MHWISVTERLPEIPQGKYGVSVLVAIFDHTYEEINPGRGYSVIEALYGETKDSKHFGSNPKQFDFQCLYCGVDSYWGAMGDPVTHWMYLPDPPKEATR